MTDAPRADADLVVVGGGIAGLVVALEVAATGARVVVLEADEHPGGMLRRGTLGGVDVDLGAESFAIRTDGVARLIDDFALPLEVVAPRPHPARLVASRWGGSLARMPLPKRTVIGVPADPRAPDVVSIIGRRAARRAAAEDRSVALDPDASFGELVAGRLGERLVERLVDPLCRSVYSQPADAAPLSRLHPALWAETVRTGSLLAAAGAVAPAAAGGSAVAGIAGGMWRLADAVHRAAVERGAEVRTGTIVDSIDPGDGLVGTVVRTADGRELRATAVVIATGPRAAAALLRLPARRPAPAVCVVSAVVRARRLAGDPVGSGVIVAPSVETPAKAMTHSDAKWAWLRGALPADSHVVRVSARADSPDGLDSAPALARELSRLTGAAVDAADLAEITVTRWRDAVVPPVTEQWSAAVDEARAHGIHVAGAVAAGTGLASVIPHARALAHDILTLTPARKELS